MAWTIEYAKTARDQLRKLDRAIARRIVEFIEKRVALRDNPREIGKALSGPLGDLWAYRVGDYRVLCDIRDGILTILVLQVGNRREVYR
ncbi:MAG: type II toxin-antitoxin system RelE/ParE family toxin [Terracidiphilus sp.]